MIPELIREVLKVAPTLATVLGGPFAGVAASLISSAFGGDPKNPQQLLDNISADKESDNKLAEIEVQNKTALQKLALEKEQMELADVQGARDMPGLSTKVRLWMLGTVIAVLMVIFAVLYFDTDASIDKLLILLAGVLIRELMAMMRLWWG